MSCCSSLEKATERVFSEKTWNLKNLIRKTVFIRKKEIGAKNQQCSVSTSSSCLCSLITLSLSIGPIMITITVLQGERKRHREKSLERAKNLGAVWINGRRESVERRGDAEREREDGRREKHGKL